MIRTTPLAAACAALLSLAACQDAPPTAFGPEDPGAPRQSVQTGWIFGRGGVPTEVRFSVVDGQGILEGDINLGPAARIAKTRAELVPGGNVRKGVTIDASSYRWNMGTVPYVISSSFTTTQRQVILNAMNHVTSTTRGIQFVARTSQTSYVNFGLHASSCDSPVGRQGGAQTINLTSGCAGSMGKVAHEILHSLGMHHEQTRCDRDSYVQILSDSIVSGMSHNFDKKCTGYTDRLGYDEGSVMHYWYRDFGKINSLGVPARTIVSLRGLQGSMGQRDSLSSTDVTTLRQIYPVYAPTGLAATYPGGVPNLSWNAVPGAVHYGIHLGHMDEEVIYDRGTFVTEWSEPLGTTTSTSFQDTQHSYTGADRCTAYNGYDTYTYNYYYDVYAYLSDGTYSYVARISAYVGVC